MAEDREPIGTFVTRQGQIVAVYHLEYGARLYVPVGGRWGGLPWEPLWEKEDPDQEAGG